MACVAQLSELLGFVVHQTKRHGFESLQHIALSLIFSTDIVVPKVQVLNQSGTLAAIKIKWLRLLTPAGILQVPSSLPSSLESSL